MHCQPRGISAVAFCDPAGAADSPSATVPYLTQTEQRRRQQPPDISRQWSRGRQSVRGDADAGRGVRDFRAGTPHRERTVCGRPTRTWHSALAIVSADGKRQEPYPSALAVPGQMTGNASGIIPNHRLSERIPVSSRERNTPVPDTIVVSSVETGMLFREFPVPFGTFGTSTEA